MQFQCLLKIDKVFDSVISNPEQLETLKRDFVKYATEEQLRRNECELQKELIYDALLGKETNYYDRIFGARKIEIIDYYSKKDK